MSKRREELIHETESHYPGGETGDMFERRVSRCFVPIASKERA